MTAPTLTWIASPGPTVMPTAPGSLDYSRRGLAFAPDGREVFRTWGSPERPWVLAVAPGSSRWTIRAWGADGPAARRAVREMFSLGDPIPEFYRLTRNEPVLRGVEHRFRGLRAPRDAHPYESLLQAVLGQQVSVASANATRRRLFARFAEPIVVDGLAVPRVPAPSRLAAAPLDELRRVGLSRAKARTVRELARRAADLPAVNVMRRRRPEFGRAALEALPGVGRWTAENVLLRGAGRRDIFLGGDLAVRVALDRFGAVPREAPEGVARRWAEEHYPGWGSYVTLYLWRRLAEEASARTA